MSPFDLALVLESGQQLGVAGLVLRGIDLEALAQAFSARQTLRVASEQDVDPASGHVGGHRDRDELTRLRDDLGFPVVLLRVQHLVRDPPLLEQSRQLLRLLDRDRADEHRLALFVPLGNVRSGRFVLGVFGLVDEVGVVDPDHGLVRRDRHDLQVVRVSELTGFGVGRAGHARELAVHAEVVLERDRGERLVLFLDVHALLGLDRLVQAFAPTATLEDPARELVDDVHLALRDQIVDVALEELLGLQRLLDLVHVVLVDVLVEVLDPERLLDAGDPLLGRHDRALCFVDLVVALALQPADDASELVVQLGGVGRAPGDDQRRTSLVDEDRIDLVDDREVVRRKAVPWRPPRCTWSSMLVTMLSRR